MAYAFTKVDDFFRRNKYGKMPSEDASVKGSLGTAPETSGQKAAPEATLGANQVAMEGAYEAAKKAPTGAIQNRALAGAQQQATDYASNVKKSAEDFATAQKAKTETALPTYTSAQVGEKVGKAAGGDTTSYGDINAALQYKPQEIAAQVYTPPPVLDATEYIRNSTGGLAAGLQRGRSGNYTAGMAALDAAAAGRNVPGLQQRVGGLQEYMNDARTQAADVSGLNIAEKDRVNSIQNMIRQQVQDKLGGLGAQYSTNLQSRQGTQATSDEAEKQAAIQQILENMRGGATSAVQSQAQLVKDLGLTDYYKAPEFLNVNEKMATPFFGATTQDVSYNSPEVEQYNNLVGLLGLESPMQSSAFKDINYAPDVGKARDYGAQQMQSALAKALEAAQGRKGEADRVKAEAAKIEADRVAAAERAAEARRQQEKAAADAAWQEEQARQVAEAQKMADWWSSIFRKNDPSMPVPVPAGVSVAPSVPNAGSRAPTGLGVDQNATTYSPTTYTPGSLPGGIGGLTSDPSSPAFAPEPVEQPKDETPYWRY